MSITTALRLWPLAIALCVAAGAASAQTTTPPQNPLPGTPPPASGPQSTAPEPPADLQACLQETGDYLTRGKRIFYVIGITNTCNARLRCVIYANVTGAKGSSLGHTVMILGAAGSGGEKKTYDMRVKAAGGTVQVSRECKVL